VDLPAGSVHTVALTAPDRRAAVHLRQPIRVLPDPGPPGILTFLNAPRDDAHVRWFGEFTDPRCNSVDPEEDGLPNVAGAYLHPSSDSDRTIHVVPDHLIPDQPYRVTVNNTVAELWLEPGDDVTFEIKRLDIHDARVTRADGSSYVVPGRYVVYREVEDDWYRPVTTSTWCASDPVISLPTGTGIDVVPGRYRVEVSYQTEEGQQQVREYVVSL
jgi:hypothetical protein